MAAYRRWQVPHTELPYAEGNERPGSFSASRGVMEHHTGGILLYPDTYAAIAYAKWIFTEGRPSEGIPAPLCHDLVLVGHVYVGASGRANHAGLGDNGVDGNSIYWGFEWAYPGTSKPPQAMYNVAALATAAILDAMGYTRATRWNCPGHKEWTSRKIDPAYVSMRRFRRDVTLLMKQGPVGSRRGIIGVI